jgi:hypothetical protein
MAADYRMLLGWGQLGPQLPNPMSLASMRMDLDKQRIAMDTALEEQRRQQSLRALMPQAFTPEGLNQQVAQQIVGLGGADQLRAAQQALMPDMGGDFAAQLRDAYDAEGNPVFIQPSRSGAPRLVEGFTPIVETPQQRAARESQKLWQQTQMEIEKERRAAELAAEKAKAQAGAKREAEIPKIENALKIISKIDELVDNAYIGGGIGARTGRGAMVVGVNLDDAKAANTAAIKALGTQLKFMAKPPGMGAMSDSEWGIIKEAVGDPDSGTPESYRAALQALKMALEGQMPDRSTLDSVMAGRPPGAVAGGGLGGQQPAGAAPAQPAPKLRFDPATGNLVPVK